MRKFFCMVFVLISLVSSTAYADEILFRDIPWRSNVQTVLGELGLWDIDEYPDRAGKDRISVYPAIIGELGYLILEDAEGYDNSGFEAGNTFPLELIVAEHEVPYIELQFMYGLDENGDVLYNKENAEFISAKYDIRTEDYPTSYADLQDKLIWLYGEPVINVSEQHSVNRSLHEKYTVWSGENNTSVILYVKYYTDDTNIYQFDLTIEYGLVDISDELTYREKYNEQVERNEKYTDKNTEGL